MCDPFSIGLALVVAGGGAKFFGEKKAQKASERTANRERQFRRRRSTEDQAKSQDGTGKSDIAKERRRRSGSQQLRNQSEREQDPTGWAVCSLGIGRVPCEREYQEEEGEERVALVGLGANVRRQARDRRRRGDGQPEPEQE